ncbi:hypothetical protein CWI84_00910 [Idiomarina tyrosinivorans]|uniref:Uncharacterized protein n=1 Tax=Idiomarina tyrosinivorans TaxID=1445662 RepID=A0A432ZTY3_9GAMM|nr:hypothetical protein [Idiomarina tyrosinivorans]RUO81349.1 hypothetical protein CWI84_00910 [Idiomarina tyrosinivorans]
MAALYLQLDSQTMGFLGHFSSPTFWCLTCAERGAGLGTMMQVNLSGLTEPFAAQVIWVVGNVEHKHLLVLQCCDENVASRQALTQHQQQADSQASERRWLQLLQQLAE